MSAARAAVLSALLTGLCSRAAAQADSVVFLLAPLSRFEVKTGKAGLFGFAGHDHVIRARGCSGRVVYQPNSPAASRVEIALSTDSLEVLTPPDTAEIRKVTEAMRSQVLHVADYPLITFVSTAVTPAEDAVAELRISGRLTMVGQTRDVTVNVHVEIGTDTLRAAGSFSVKQTDFGIKPYRGGPAGTVRVADRVSITLTAVAVRATGP